MGATLAAGLGVLQVLTGCAARETSAAGSSTPIMTPARNVSGTPVATSGTASSPAFPPATSTDPACRPYPLANVYHPDRLKVLDSCKTVSGTVTLLRHEDDGDYHLNLAVDAQFAGLLNATNLSDNRGYLVLEIVPADQPGCPFPAPSPGYDYGQCTNTNLSLPPRGQHISVTGPYVLDQEHGWNEIHPIWAWTATEKVAPSGGS